jgi:hypothetical protein
MCWRTPLYRLGLHVWLSPDGLRASWRHLPWKLGWVRGRQVNGSALAQLDRALDERLRSTMAEEVAATDVNLVTKGAVRQRDRLSWVAEWRARTYPGDFVEIGAYMGETTVRLAQVAQAYGRRVIVVDPWQVGTQNCEGHEYDIFPQT